MAEPLFHPEARSDYESAWAWYHERNPAAAARFGAEVERLLESIAANPEAFPQLDDEHRFTLPKRFPYGLVFRGVSDPAVVVAVAHSSRSPGYWHDRIGE